MAGIGSLWFWPVILAPSSSAIAMDAATALIAMTTPQPSLTPVQGPGTTAPHTLPHILRELLGSGLVQQPVKLNKAQFMTCIVQYFYLLISYYYTVILLLILYHILLPFLLLHCCDNTITHYYIFLNVLLQFLLLHCYNIINTYYCIIHYYVLLPFLLLHCYYMIIYIIICYYIVIITYCYDIILHIKFMLLHIITYSVITHYYYFCYYMREGCSLRGRVGRGEGKGGC